MKHWECFEDVAYYGMYALRPVGDMDFNSQELIHIGLKSEAERMQRILNQYEQKLDRLKDGLHSCKDTLHKLQGELDHETT